MIRLGNIALISTSLSPRKALFPLNLAAQLFHSIDSFIGGTMQSVVLSAYSSRHPAFLQQGVFLFGQKNPRTNVVTMSVREVIFSEYIRFYRKTDKTDISPFSACGYSRRCGHAGYSRDGTGGAVRRFCRRVRGSRRDSRYPVPHTAARQRPCR